MFFSLSTVALVASSLVGMAGVDAAVLTERSNSLCNQANYGASGYPWQQYSTPGCFCSSHKPSNSAQWGSVPYWDGGDSVRCNTYQHSRYNVCSGGNKHTSLPSKCNPPHKHSPSSSAKSSSAAPTTAKTSSSAAVVISSSAAVVSSSAVVVSSSAAVVSSSAASTANSVVVSSAGSSSSSSAAALTTPVSSSTPFAITAPVTSSSPVISTVNSSAVVITNPVTSTSTSSAAAATATVDPLSDPVCELQFQVTYTNFTLTAPNGVWDGLTVGAAAQDASYMTYTLATSIDDCLNACSQIEGCTFVNTYYDTNPTEAYLPKHTPGVLTCTMFSSCVPTSQNNNWGGQDDPNEIYQSNGYCLSSACTST